MKLNLGRERQNRSKVVSIWESSRSCSLDTANLIFSTLDITIGSQKAAGPIGEPRRQKPDLEMGTSGGGGGGRGLLEASAPCGIKRSDFDLLRIKPLEGPSSSTISRALSKSSGEPHRVPSSKYQTLMCKFHHGITARNKPIVQRK